MVYFISIWQIKKNYNFFLRPRFFFLFGTLFFSFRNKQKLEMSPSTSSEREPLLAPIHSVPKSSGSVVSYTISQQKCSNVTLKDRSVAKSTKRKLWFAVGLACCFFATELVAGYFANSLGKVLIFLLIS
jgi:hypothetical protein